MAASVLVCCVLSCRCSAWLLCPPPLRRQRLHFRYIDIGAVIVIDFLIGFVIDFVIDFVTVIVIVV